MMSYWANLQTRERRIVIVGAVALVLMGLYALIWEPYSDAVQSARKGIETKRTTLDWMRGAAEQVRALKASGGASASRGDQSLLSLVDGSARSHGLGGMLKRVQPDGADAVRVWLEDAPFDGALRWMGELHRSRGLVIEGLVVERAEKAGHANLRLVLEEGG